MTGKNNAQLIETITLLMLVNDRDEKSIKNTLNEDLYLTDDY